MSKSISVSGINDLLGRLSQLGDDGDDAMLETVARLTEETRAIALENIDPGSGPAAPGSYPHEQTGELKREIGAELPTKANPVGRVGTGWNIGLWLEVGTKKMKPRPWLLRSFKTATRDAARDLKSTFLARL